MATSTVKRTKGQIGLEKQNNVAIEKEPEQQIKDEQWEFIRDEVEKLLRKSNRSSKYNKRKLENKKLSLRLKKNKGFKHSEKRPKIQYYKLKGG